MSIEPIEIVHAKSGARAVVHPYGATVTSYKTSTGREMLFVSRLAKMDATKAIRGGIPLVFPQFGRPDDSYPQHGFLRCNTWTAAGEVSQDGDEAASADFTLKLADATNARGGSVWGLREDGSAAGGVDCTVTLTVRVSPSSLTTTLTVKTPPESAAFDYQCLFHSYHSVSGGSALDADSCYVSGLGGYSVEDKVTGESYTLGDGPITVGGEVDRIYTPPDGKPEVDAIVRTGKDGSSASVKASATQGGSVVPVSCVVWNPHLEKAKGMGDFGDDQYHDMICVEPGVLKGGKLGGGEEVVFTQVITAL